ncbi:MAG TPA: YwiC-like family protein [Terriglobales bacterium]
MHSAVEAESAVQKARTRALVVPREHGAWGLLLVPLFTGLVAGFASSYRLLPLALFTITALALFWLRTPVESLIGSSPIAAHTPRERFIALFASIVLAAIAAVCLAALLWGWRNQGLLLVGGIAAVALVVQAVLRKLGRSTRMASQFVGSIGLTATAPAAYYLGSGRLDSHAIILWAANWAFACDQVHFVQLRIHAGRASNFSEKFAKGKFFFLGQIALTLVLIFAALRQIIAPLVLVAFVPGLIRGTRWFFLPAAPLDVKKLGWSEMRQGIIFGVLLALAFVVHWQ